MILIISKNGELSVDSVIDWLIHFNIPYTLLNEDNFFDIEIDFFSFENTKINNIPLSKIKVAWFWKYPNIFNGKLNKEIIENIGYTTYDFMLNEYEAYKNFLFNNIYKLNHIKWLTNPKLFDQNKLTQLYDALRFDLKIPNTSIISNKNKLNDFFIKNSKGIINKPILNCKHQVFKNIDKTFFMKTLLIENFNNIPDNFFPSLMQERIIKQYEVRIFYILNSFFSVKIIEPDDLKDVDQRVGQSSGSLRYETIEIPMDIKLKLENLLSFYDLNCASIDMIVDLKGEYFFLEINPTGQFSYHSYYTNTPLEFKIAEGIKKLYEKQYE